MAETLRVANSKHLKNTGALKYILQEYNLSSYTITDNYMNGWDTPFVLMNFNAPADENIYKMISSATATIRFKVTEGASDAKIRIGSLAGAFNADDNKCSLSSVFKEYSISELTIGSYKSANISLSGDQITEVARYGLYVTISGATSANVTAVVDVSSFALTLNYSTSYASGSLTNLYPAANTRVDRTKAITFSASFSQYATHRTYAPIKVTSYQLKYKKSSDSTYTYVNTTPTSPTSVLRTILDANTLTQGTYEYQYIANLNSGGASITSSYISILSNDTVPTAPTNLIPNGTIEDGAKAITLSWTHNNESGTDASKSEIYSSTNGEDYSLFKTVNGSATTTTVNLTSANLYDGAFYWKVRTYNIDSNASPFSEPVHFNVITAPNKPTITNIIIAPMLTVEWSASEQLAYEVVVDGVTKVKAFGSAKRWNTDELLSEGAHTISIAVQGATGLWSEYRVTTVNIVNEPYGTITLDAVSADDVTLTWQSTVEHYEYHIYRNGECIGTTTELTYTDEFSAGATEYFVRGVMNPSTYYTQSNSVNVDVKCETMICVANGGEWLKLTYSDTQHRVENINLNRNVQYVHMSGRKYQEVERSEHYSETMQVTCAFLAADYSSKRLLESMNGEMVVLKTNKGRVIRGCMDALTVRDTEMYTTYSFTITRLEDVNE